MNVELVLAFIDTIDRTDFNTTCVVRVNARLSNNVCHIFKGLFVFYTNYMERQIPNGSQNFRQPVVTPPLFSIPDH